MKFGTTKNQYGKKLWIKFDYDEQLINQIKNLPWEQTHRSWNEDKQRWELDHNQEAIKLFEEYTGRTVPQKYKPNKTNKKQLQIVVPQGYTWFFLDNPPRIVDRELDQLFSYEAPGHEYSDKYKSGTWDGKVHLYSTKHSGAPVGLLSRAKNHLQTIGYSVKVTDERKARGKEVDFDWNFPHELRDYQEKAIVSAEVEGKGIISMATGAGKTVTALKLIHEISERSLVFVHTKELLYQWERDIKEALGVQPGLIGDGRWSEGPVTIAIMQTLMSKGTEKLDDNYGVMIFDECHRTSAAEEMHQIGMDIEVKKRFGLSATPWRRVNGEELKIEGAIGEKVVDVGAEELIENGYLSKPEFEVIDGCYRATGRDYHKVYKIYVVENQQRNKRIAQRAEELRNEGHKVFIDVKRIAHGEHLSDLIEDSIFLDGSDDSETRNRVISRFDDPEENFVLISTLLKEGVDIPNMSAIILAGGGKSDISVIQTIGRALRPKNGDKAAIVDVRDRGKFVGDHFRERQEAMEKYYGDYYQS